VVLHEKLDYKKVAKRARKYFLSVITTKHKGDTAVLNLDNSEVAIEYQQSKAFSLSTFARKPMSYLRKK